MASMLGKSLRIAVLIAGFAPGYFHPVALVDGGWNGARAQPAGTEKDAFEATKELGTGDAWEAFLRRYPTGFYADLARAYLKKLGEQPGAPPPPVTSATQDFDYPMVAGTWGGIVRSGPGQDTEKLASLKEGEEVTLMGPPVPVTPNDYPWFKIAFRNGRTGFMWGGLLCSTGPERPDLFKLCTFTPVRGPDGGGPTATDKPSKPRAAGGGGRPSWCAAPGNGTERAICADADLWSLDSVLNVAYRRARYDSPGARQDIEHWQKRWLGQRNLCGDDAECIRRRYLEQIQVLESYFAN